MLVSAWFLPVSFHSLSSLPGGAGILKIISFPSPQPSSLFAAEKFHWELSLFPATLFASSTAGFSHRYLYSSPDFNYLANLFNFHREWESENSRSFITAHTGGEFFTPLPSPMFAGKLCQIQTNSLIITCLFTYALLAVKYSGPFCGPLLLAWTYYISHHF